MRNHTQDKCVNRDGRRRSDEAKNFPLSVKIKTTTRHFFDTSFAMQTPSIDGFKLKKYDYSHY